MNKELEKQLAAVFERDYVNYDYFIDNVINKIFIGDEVFEALPVPESILDETNRTAASNAGIQSIFKIGSIDAIEGIDIYDITLCDSKQLQYNRVGIQQLIRSQQIFYSNAFLLFHNENTEGKEWRFSFFYKQGKNKDTTSAKRYTYLFGRGCQTRTASERFAQLADMEKNTDNLLDAFSVEALSDEFYEEFDKLYSSTPYPNCAPGFIEEFEANPEMLDPFLDKSQTDIEKQKKPMRDYVKKLMGRLIFMQFLQKKGWLGVPADCEGWNNGNQHFLQDIFLSSSYRETFLDDVLEPIFFEFLNTPYELRKKKYLNIDGKEYKIPYLNGGLFEQTELDRKESKFSVDLFQRLFDLFDRFNFTIDENDPDDIQVSVDPEMLGRIFENQLEDNNDKGAFYTPKFIVQEMCRESLISYLQTGVTQDKEKIRTFVETHDKNALNSYQQKEVLAKLKSVAICDPAIGSGAFPVGLLKELFYCRQELEPIANTADTKKQIIQENIYGVDLEQGAVDIARLRFWLSIVVDCERPEPLPNLDYKIVSGNSLLPTFNNQYIDVSTKAVINGQYVTRSSAIPIRSSKKALQAEQRCFYNLNGDEKYRSAIAIKKHILDIIWFQLDYERMSCLEGNKTPLDVFGNPIKGKVKKQVQSFTPERQAILDECESLQKKLDDSSLSLKDRSEIVLPFFDWEIIFSDIFDHPKEEKGFDIVIGNPPYFVYEGNNKDELPILRKQEPFKIAFGGKLNAYKLFLAHALQVLLKPNGINCFIFQNSFLADLQAANLRNYVLNNCQILKIDSYPERDSKKKRVFESVKMSVCIFLAQNFNPQMPFVVNIWNDKHKSSGITTHFTKEEIAEIDPVSLTIPRLREEAKPIVLKMIERRAIYIKCLEGELNVTSHRPFFSNDNTLPVIMKGAGIQKYYYTFDMSQGEIEYLKEKEYLDKCGNSEKAHHHESERIVMQGMTGANDKIRLVMSIVPKGMYLGHSCKYILPSDDITQNCLLGVMNSKLANFFFRCFSTNSNVNGYEIEAIPICNIPQDISVKIEANVTSMMSTKKQNHSADISQKENAIDLLVYHLYGLTYDEVLIVDPETPITREEYEKRK